MTELLPARAIGQALPRLDGPLKVTGRAPYAYEQPVDNPAYLHLVQSTVARGRIASIDTTAALAVPGVLTVITHENAPRLASDQNKELWVLQSPDIAYRGELIGAVVAETPEIARDAASLVRVTYQEQPHDVDLRADRFDVASGEVGGLYRPEWSTTTRSRCTAQWRSGTRPPGASWCTTRTRACTRRPPCWPSHSGWNRARSTSSRRTSAAHSVRRRSPGRTTSRSRWPPGC